MRSRSSGRTSATPSVASRARTRCPTSDFRLLYDVGRGKVEHPRPQLSARQRRRGRLLPAPGQPGDQGRRPTERPKKTVVFVIDRSGSMSGKKIEQVRGGAEIRARTTCTRATCSTSSPTTARSRPSGPSCRVSMRRPARPRLGFVEGIYAGGSTNIDGALQTALAQLQDSSRPNYIVFLTDGLPTTGVTNEAKIVANMKEANKVQARIFAFGVGYDVNGRLLGQAGPRELRPERVRPAQRGHRGSRQPPLSPHRVAGDDRREDRVRPGRVEAEEGSPINRVYPEGLVRPVCRRATGRGGPLQAAGHGQGGRQRHGRRPASRSSISPPSWSRRAATKATASSRSSGPSAAWARSSTKST